MTTFRIIEQKSRNLSEIYEEFKTLYLDPTNSVSDVKKKLNLTNSEYKHLREDLKEETGIEIKPNYYNKMGLYDNPMKHIHKRGNVYEIRKGRVYYGRFNKLEDAQKHRDALVKNNWKEI